MTTKTYQIQIGLKGSKPKIWRRILVPSDLLLSDFHKIIQTTMGWTNSHLHQFIKNRTFYLQRMADDDLWDDLDNVDYSKMKISDLLKKEKDKIIYEYDFGDSWEHDIILEKIEKNGVNEIIPTCLTGKNNCPPEDCGGIWGYSNLLEILKHPEHEEYEEYVEWLGGEFDPKYFDKNEINKMLKTKDFGCYGLF
ncbi:MAG: plasmid pRiA4b ORF-3 family protein [Chlorobi bacterium]|nr:plasmid pRiA4b ORF-3 family protein [Chlorobiota bacterium]